MASDAVAQNTSFGRKMTGWGTPGRGAVACPFQGAAANFLASPILPLGEYAQGHLEGARSIDVQASDFDSQVSALPTDGAYIVYCRSGSRSAAASARMAELGFTSVTDAGAMSDATVSTGLPVVTAP